VNVSGPNGSSGKDAKDGKNGQAGKGGPPSLKPFKFFFKKLDWFPLLFKSKVWLVLMGRMEAMENKDWLVPEVSHYNNYFIFYFIRLNILLFLIITATPGKNGKDGASGQYGQPGQYGTDGKDGQSGTPGPVGPERTPGCDGTGGQAGTGTIEFVHWSIFKISKK
jgi:hypothetical protein